jgi:hypothetical protein
MKKSTIGVAVIVLASLAVIGAQPQVRKAKEKDRPKGTIEGTWQKPIADQPNLNQVKMFHQGHFLWVTYDRQNRVAVSSGGGTYTLDGRTYKERVMFGRFGTPELQALVGNVQDFRILVDGDTLNQWGIMSNGEELHEIWRRVR